MEYGLIKHNCCDYYFRLVLWQILPKLVVRNQSQWLMTLKRIWAYIAIISSGSTQWTKLVHRSSFSVTFHVCCWIVLTLPLIPSPRSLSHNLDFSTLASLLSKMSLNSNKTIWRIVDLKFKLFQHHIHFSKLMNKRYCSKDASRWHFWSHFPYVGKFFDF